MLHTSRSCRETIENSDEQSIMNSSFWHGNVGCRLFLRRKTPGKLENANVPIDNSVITNDG